jgi:G-protein signaling modulator 2
MQDDLLDLIAGMQSKRMDEQRVALPHLPGLLPPTQMGGDGDTTPDDTFLEMLMRCQVSPSSLLCGVVGMCCEV